MDGSHVQVDASAWVLSCSHSVLYLVQSEQDGFQSF